ncbi:MAG: hypothetical protein ACREQ3_06410, partial [Candidatus Binatia bacterium]
MAGHKLVWVDGLTRKTTDGAICDVTQAELGLAQSEVSDLFYQCEDIDDLWATAERITNGEIK